MKSQNEILDHYVENFFKVLKEDDPKLYIKTMRLCRAGKGGAISKILWEVLTDVRHRGLRK